MAHDKSGSTSRRTIGTIATFLLATAIVGVVRADPPLTTVDLVRFLRAGISERTILTELEGRGFGESLDDAREATLREAGASETLVVAVRRAVRTDGSRPLPVGGPSPSGTTSAKPAPLGSVPGPGGPTFSVSTHAVRIPVAVVDSTGEPVLGLRVEDFKVQDQGRNQPVALFSNERRALRIALALDVSGSMRNKIREVEGALRHFIDVLEPADEILVLTFNDDVTVLQDFTSDRDQLSHVLTMLEPDGGTALYDAAAEAIRRVAPGPAESKAVVLVTDGVDTESLESFDSVRELARRYEVPVFSIGLDSGETPQNFFRRPGSVGGRGGFPGFGGRRRPGGGGGGGGSGWGGGRWGRPEGFDGTPLNKLAEETGGLAEIVRNLGHYSPDSDERSGDQLKKAVESIAMTLRHRYLLGYDMPDGNKGWRSIKITVDRPSTTARARKGYYAG
jgi:VWFA-related protein